MKTEFHFISTAFNRSQSKDYFINPESYGDDLAYWLVGELSKRQIKITSKPEQEDFGWYFNFLFEDKEHCVVVAFKPNNPSIGDEWFGWVERRVGFLSSLFGGRNRGIIPGAVVVISDIIETAPEITNIRWQNH